MDITLAGLPFTSAQEEEPVTEEPVHEEEHNPILPEVDEIIIGGLAFLIVFVVLWRYAFPRLNEAMANRTAKIQGDLEKAESERLEAEQVRRRYEEQLQEARTESGRIIDEARKTAEQLRRDVLEKADEEARQVVARAQEEIRAERDRAFEQLRAQVGELSVDLASRVIDAELDPERQRQLVDDYIDGLGNGDGG